MKRTGESEVVRKSRKNKDGRTESRKTTKDKEKQKSNGDEEWRGSEKKRG